MHQTEQEVAREKVNHDVNDVANKDIEFNAKIEKMKEKHIPQGLDGSTKSLKSNM